MCWMLLLFMSLKNTYICSFIHQLDHSWIFGTIVNTRNTMVSKIFFPQPLKRSLQSSFSWSQTRKEAASLEDDTLWDGQARLPGEGTWLNPRPAALPSQYKTKAETWKVVGWGSDGVLDRERRWQVQSPRARESSVHRQSSVSSLELPVIQNEWVQKVVKKKKKKKLRDCSGKHQPTPECLVGYLVLSDLYPESRFPKNVAEWWPRF